MIEIPGHRPAGSGARGLVLCHAKVSRASARTLTMAFFPAGRRQPEPRGGPGVRLQEFPHQGKRLAVFLGGVRGRAVGGNNQVVVAHVSVVRREEEKFTAMPAMMR